MAITTELVIARHGEAICNLLGIVGGERGCTGLSERGRAQARHLARRLAAEHEQRPFDVCYTSPRLRVRQTADVVAAALGLPIVANAELRGPDHGKADGQPWREIKTAFGGPPQHDPARPYAPGAESWLAYLTRATAALAAVVTDHGGKRILIIGHGETIYASHVLLLRLNLEMSRVVGFVADHTGLTRWQRQVNRMNQTTWLLAAHNDTRHLDGEP
jgi:probable phosphoglycerate mutase